MAGKPVVRTNLTMSSGDRWTITTVRQEFRIDFHTGMVELADFGGRLFPLIDDVRFRIHSINVLELGAHASFTMTIPKEGGYGMQHTFTTDPVTSIIAAPKARRDGRIHVDLSKIYRDPYANSAASMEYRLGIDSSQLAAMVTNHQVLQLTTWIGTDIYPPFQVLEGGRLLPGLHEVLCELADGTNDRWTWWLWLTSRPYWASGPAVWELMSASNADAVVRAAGRAAWAWRQ